LVETKLITQMKISTDKIKQNNKPTHNTVYKKLLVLGLNKGRCTFATSEFPSEIPRMQTRNFPYTNPLPAS